MARRRKRKPASEFENPPGSFDLSAGQSRALAPFPQRSPLEIESLRRYLNVENPPTGVDIQPTIGEEIRALLDRRSREPPPAPAAGGWGTPLRGWWKNHGTAKNPKWVWVSIPVGLVVAWLGVWGAMKAVEGFSRLWPGATPVQALTPWSLLTAFVPSNDDIRAIQGGLHGAALPSPGVVPAGLPPWLITLIQARNIQDAAAGGPILTMTPNSDGSVSFHANATYDFVESPEGSIFIVKVDYVNFYKAVGYTDLHLDLLWIPPAPNVSPADAWWNKLPWSAQLAIYSFYTTYPGMPNQSTVNGWWQSLNPNQKAQVAFQFRGLGG